MSAPPPSHRPVSPLHTSALASRSGRPDTQSCPICAPRLISPRSRQPPVTAVLRAAVPRWLTTLCD